MNISMVSLQNMPQSAMVRELKPYSSVIWWAGSRRTMSYVRSKISRKVRLLCWNQEPFFMDIDEEHWTPATILRHRHLNLSRLLGSADHFISRPHLLHCTLPRSRPTSFRNSIAISSSKKRYTRKSLFGPPSGRRIRRRYEGLATNCISCRRFSYSLTTCNSLSTISHTKKRTQHHTQLRSTERYNFGARIGGKGIVVVGEHEKRGEKVNRK